MNLHPPKPLSIALLSPGWPASSFANGIVSYLDVLVPALRKLGVQCHVLTRRLAQENPPWLHQLTVKHNLRSRLMGRVMRHSWPHRTMAAAILEQVRRLHEQEGVALLEMEDSFGWCQYLAGKSPVPVVVRLHGPWFLNGIANGVPQDDDFHRRDRCERAGVIAADAITAPSQDVLDRAQAHFGLEFARARVIPNPVQLCTPDNRWNLQECDPTRIAFIGRFDRHKGGDTTIDALARVVSAFPQAKLDFVGPDPGVADESGYRWDIEQYVLRRLGEANAQKVTYHGFLPGAQAAGVRKRALVTVVPSRYETFGITAAEAMMAGCPLVVSGAGGLKEMFQHGRNGLICSAGDAEDLAAKVLELLSAPLYAARLGEQASRDAQERYAPQVIARQTLEFYQQISGSAAAPLASVDAMPRENETIPA